MNKPKRCSSFYGKWRASLYRLFFFGLTFLKIGEGSVPMRQKNVIIVRAYHFMAEMLIIFLLAVPFLNVSETLYWSYAGVASGICILFTFYATRTYTNS